MAPIADDSRGGDRALSQKQPFQVEMPSLALGVMTPDLRQRLDKF